MIEASAPVRICDNGGWTDTWFGGPGRVLNIAVNPGVKVSIERGSGDDGIVLNVKETGDRYPIVPGEARAARHRLLEAAIDDLPPPPGVSVEITVRSAVPPGSGTGTSAAVSVALLGALAAFRGDRRSRRDLAYEAHRLEVDVLGGECGIQDQLSSALGGINYLEIEAYPEADVTRLPQWDELNDHLTVVYLGRAHDSSSVHRQVIERLRSEGSPALSRLRDAATAARNAVLARDLAEFGRSMIENTEAQRSLDPGLVGRDAALLIDLAAAEGALGWKVNGAGGDGGSLTLLSSSFRQRQAIQERVVAVSPGYELLPLRLSAEGLCVSEA